MADDVESVLADLSTRFPDRVVPDFFSAYYNLLDYHGDCCVPADPIRVGSGRDVGLYFAKWVGEVCKTKMNRDVESYDRN